MELSFDAALELLREKTGSIRLCSDCAFCEEKTHLHELCRRDLHKQVLLKENRNICAARHYQNTV